jgi:putative membrane-bound dehydrogenase-like protein
MCRLLFVCLLFFAMSKDGTADNLPLIPVGAATVDITPDYPVRLAGYASRQEESDGITARIHARALAIGGAGNFAETVTQPLAVLVTVDNCGVTADVVESVFDVLSADLPLQRSHFALSSTHTHSAPWLRSFAPLSQLNIAPDHQRRLERYQRELQEQLVQVVRNAVEARRPGRLSLGYGHVDFAKNRRVLRDGKYSGSGIQEDGPVDHRLPILAAHDAAGTLIAVLTNYACHATTNAGADNRVGGDWPGFAADMMEQDHPGAVALVAVGCGADINPLRSREEDYSAQHGRSFADSVHRVLTNQKNDNESALKPLNPTLKCRLSRISLPFGPLPSRQEWEAQAGTSGVAGELARRMLKRIDSGAGIPAELSEYPVQTWAFGSDLAMVFLAGEVVQDYSIRMSQMFDADRLWVNAYCNDVPCYIPSKRVLREGGYEAERSMDYYGLPTRLSPEIEDRICWAVQKQLPHLFYTSELLAEYPGPLSPQDSLAAMSTRADFRVELVAAEPLIQDPVAFDWDTSGRLWVVEMGDYPLGPNGGRVRVLTDEDSDGTYDSAVTFLDNLAFPSGICVWRNGAIITAAPDIIYAEDANGDGFADETTVLCTGFGEGNQQHRVNGLRWGLDGWLYLANGDSGGRVQVVGATGPEGGRTIDDQGDPPVDGRGRDLRIQPDRALLEAISGQTQFCRERDDFGQWFGNNNSNPIWHYIIENRYVQRNPFTKIGRPTAQVSFQPGAAPVYPTSQTTARFNDFHAANRFTSACGTAIYRDTVLGTDCYGSALTCEPVHNLVSRLVLRPNGVTFHGVRADAEAQSEFLAGSDNWFRPTMTRTGPDGALFVCDMYRQVIEHPQWIPAAAQRRLDLRAGSDLGRIYRISPKSAPPISDDRSWLTQPWDQVSMEQLVSRLRSPNAWWRDAAQRILQHRQNEWTEDVVDALPWNHESPAVRVQAVCSAAMAGRLTASRLLTALSDPDPRVRRRVTALLEDTVVPETQLGRLLKSLAQDTDPGVRMQLACTLGSLPTAAGATVLARLFTENQDEEWIRKAALTSLNAQNVVSVLKSVTESKDPNGELVSLLIRQCQQLGQTADVREPIIRILQAMAAHRDVGTADIVTAANVAAIVGSTSELNEDPEMLAAVNLAADRALSIILDDAADNAQLVAALEYVSATGARSRVSTERLGVLIRPTQPDTVQRAALDTLLQTGSVEHVLKQWNALSPDRRKQALDAIVSREESVNLLLSNVAEGSLTAADLGAVYRDQLLNHQNRSLQARAKQVLGEESLAGRGEIAKEWTSMVLALTGSPQRGEAVFRKSCATCHKLQDVGNQIGAELASLRDRTTPALVTAVLNPNKAVETRFMNYTAVLRSGRTVSGMLQNETGNSVTLLGTDGKPHELLRSELDELLASNRSFMPEGLEKDLLPQGLADVIAFVQSTGTPWKQFQGNAPHVVTAGDDGFLTLTAAAGEIYGPSVTFDSDRATIDNWQSSDDHVAWQLHVRDRGFWTVEFEYTCDDTAAGNQLKLASHARMMTARVPGTGTNSNFRRWTAGAVELSSGPITLTLSAGEDLTSSLFNLKSVRLIPPTKD